MITRFKFKMGVIARQFAECRLKVGEVYSDVAGSSFNPENTEFTMVARANHVEIEPGQLTSL